MQTPGEPRALAACPAVSQREEKCVSSSTSRRWPSRAEGQHSHLLVPRQPALGRRDPNTSRGGRNGRCDSESSSTRARSAAAAELLSCSARASPGLPAAGRRGCAPAGGGDSAAFRAAAGRGTARVAAGRSRTGRGRKKPVSAAAAAGLLRGKLRQPCAGGERLAVHRLSSVDFGAAPKIKIRARVVKSNS